MLNCFDIAESSSLKDFRKVVFARNGKRWKDVHIPSKAKKLAKKCIEGDLVPAINNLILKVAKEKAVETAAKAKKKSKKSKKRRKRSNSSSSGSEDQWVEVTSKER